MVKNPPVMRETWVRSLGQEDPLRKAWQLTPVFLPEESPWTTESGSYSLWGCKDSDMTEQLSIHTHNFISQSLERQLGEGTWRFPHVQPGNLRKRMQKSDSEIYVEIDTPPKSLSQKTPYLFCILQSAKGKYFLYQSSSMYFAMTTPHGSRSQKT